MKRRLEDNWKRVTDRVAAACARCGRAPGSVTIVAVTKSADTDIIRELIRLGVVHLGENRVQELARRATEIAEWLAAERSQGAVKLVTPQWHMIGHLQRNKVKPVLPHVSLIHSVDSLRLAEELDMHSEKLGRVTPVLLEVNSAGESTKTGVAVAAALHLAEQLNTLPHLELRGMMTMAPLTDDQNIIRHAFERTRELYDEMLHERVGGPKFRELSMGMSNDFELAIEFGATMVRCRLATRSPL